MSDSQPSDSPPPEDDAFRREIADLVRRALLELGEMAEIQEQIKAVSERLSKVTPLPEKKAGDSPDPATE